MRNLLLVACVALGGLLYPPAAEAVRNVAPGQRMPEIAFSRPEAILKWINDYRLKPEPDRLPDAVKAMARLGVFRELEQAGIYLGFAGGVLADNPKKAEKLIAAMFPMPPADQIGIIRAIVYSGLPNWKTLLGKFIERMPARKVLIHKYLYGDGKTLEQLPLDKGADVLDSHWGFYFATGWPQPVRRIISSLAWSKDGDNIERLTIGSMSKWTLAKNALGDKVLLDLMKAELGNQPKAVITPLREVIVAVETYEIETIRKEAMAAIQNLKIKGPESARKFAWWGQAGQTALALGCIVAGALGQIELGLPCVLGGALSGLAIKYFTPGQE